MEDARKVGEVAAEDVFSRPQSDVRGGPKSTLVIGEHSKTVARQRWSDTWRAGNHVEGFAIVVEAVNGQDHAIRFSLRQPPPDGKR